MSPDSELVGAYVVEGSETAFRTLVARHANLVYSTALRQVGDSGLAEEITQNVFITLAKKAPRLSRVETLAGWLHRTAIFESKTRIRSELRRRTREQTAAALAETERQEDTSLEALVPLVDEALLDLRESDRLALVLRYFENRSLREVGGVLGVDEDAARKRISRALIRVMDFFQRRGFTLPVGTGMVVLLTSSAKAAPAGLITAATKTGFAAGKSVSGVSLLLFNLMNMGTKKAVVGCLLLAAAPLLWQSQVEARLNQEQAALQKENTQAARKLQELESKTRDVSAFLAPLQTEVQNAQAHLATINAQRTGKVKAPVYQWDDNSPYMRVPKEFLQQLPQSVRYRNERIEISETAREFLQMDENESQQTQAAVQNFFDSYQTALMQKMRRVEPSPKDLRGRKPEEVRIYEVDAMTEEVKQLRKSLFAQLEDVLGQERFPIFRSTLGNWMPLDDKFTGMSSGWEVIESPHRRGFYMPKPGSSLIPSSTHWERGSRYSPLQCDEVPRAFAPDLQDWIALARSQQPATP